MVHYPSHHHPPALGCARSPQPADPYQGERCGGEGGIAITHPLMHPATMLTTTPATRRATTTSPCAKPWAASPPSGS